VDENAHYELFPVDLSQAKGDVADGVVQVDFDAVPEVFLVADLVLVPVTYLSDQ